MTSFTSFARWLIPLLRKGLYNDLSTEDLHAIDDSETSKFLTDNMEKLWQEEALRPEPRYARALMRYFGGSCFKAGLSAAIAECILRIAQPVLLGQLLRHLGGVQGYEEVWKGWAFGTGIILCSLLYLFTFYYHSFSVRNIGMKMRIASCGLIYRKSLRLSKSALANTTVGEMVNLLSNDVNRFDTSLVFCNFLWIAPLQLSLVLGLLYHMFGLSGMTGVAFLIILIPLQCYMGNVFSRLRQRTAQHTDERVRIMNEIVNAIKVVKMFAWEPPFMTLVSDARKKEIGVIRRSNFLKAVNEALFFSSAKLAICLTVITYVLTGSLVTAEKEFFIQEEIAVHGNHVSENVLLISGERFEDEQSGVAIRELRAQWCTGTRTTLDDITATVMAGELLVVVGPVGAGKSSLLHCLLGELPALHGRVRVSGKIAYAAQEPWLFSDSIRKNILFGKEYVPVKYAEIIKVCGLDADLKQLADGDLTFVGERGTTLSGGQKARISLARALYQDGDVVLLDDPLSAVDAAVGKQLFDLCIRGYLRRKAVILVTHQLQYISAAHNILVLLEVRRSPPAAVHQRRPQHPRAARGETEPTSCSTSAPPTTSSCCSRTNELHGQTHQGAINGHNIFNQTTKGLEVDVPFTSFTFAQVYGALVCIVLILSLGRTVLFFMMCCVSSRRLHDNMFQAVMRAPMRYFDTQPIGHVLNCFTKDMGQIDDLMPMCLWDFLTISLNTVGIIAMIGFVFPYMFIPTAVFVVVLILLRRLYLHTARDIRRLEAITRSPVFSHLSTSLDGLTTIRAFRTQRSFIRGFDHLQDLHTSSYSMITATTQWYGFSLDGLSAFFVACVIITCIAEQGHRSGDIGLAIYCALMLTNTLQWGVRQSAEVENQMISVERVLALSELQPEASLISDEGESRNANIKPGWPTSGQIDFRNVSLRYEENQPMVLKNISFTISSGEKIGIVGRTGAGKSSLISCLLRLTEPAGQINIDGVDIGKLGLHTLRKNISIIPQDPVLFNGSLRMNLDPFDEYSDDQLWNALNEVQLKEGVQASPDGLDQTVEEGGSNLSVGQRQLVCLARAILSHNRILLIDEATANVDSKADELIQRTIREKFKQCTVLTVAHRLQTIMDSTRVMVISAGKIHELDAPHSLLQDRASLFSRLVRQADDATAERLHNIAREAYKKRNILTPPF
ncbi:ATP-binding cassette sub-family C member 4 [Hyalella azteca]|uniref:ATP-binding cassette sub-family C member 4 n=1 Tax=Hyalella azteca TaxID=294128 RepID=A0A979FQD0_HYAAZ|nr:ATP-binding cassette sub-family C member 4 [Hyalella azteca]